MKNKIKNMKKSDRASYVKHIKEKAGVGGKDKDKGSSRGKSKGKGKGVKY